MRKPRQTNPAQKNSLDGGEAILEALRALDIDYVMTSPGSEWGSLWEAFARQDVTAAKGPGYMSCGHESLAVGLAIGYTRHTGRMQAVVLHAGVGLLQGSMGIDAAQRMNVPMLIFSGESLTYGEQEGFDPGQQWTYALSVVGGPHRLMAPIVKWAGPITSSQTTYQMIVRGGEIAQSMPPGPVYLSMPIETMLAQWSPPGRRPQVARALPTHAPQSAIARVAALLLAARNPLIVTESAGRDAAGYEALAQLAELLAIPVIENVAAEFSNFAKTNPLHQGFSLEPFAQTADVVLVVRSRMPWYGPGDRPARATVVVIDEQPVRTNMVYQNLQADIVLEGDVPHALGEIAAAARTAGSGAKAIAARRKALAVAHGKARAIAAAASGAGIDPAMLCRMLGETLPRDAIYIDETITHRRDTLRHLDHQGAQSYYRCGGGLGQGLGMALGVKLAARDRLVAAVMGDGTFLYNPLPQALAFSRQEKLPILVVVLNNGGYLAMKREHHAYYPDGIAAAKDRSHGFPITAYEYSEIAKLFGGVGIRVDRAADLPAALAQCVDAVENGRTAILDVIVTR